MRDQASTTGARDAADAGASASASPASITSAEPVTSNSKHEYSRYSCGHCTPDLQDAAP